MDGRAGWGFRDMWAGANLEGMNSLRFCELALQTAPPFFLAFTDVQLGEWEIGFGRLRLWWDRAPGVGSAGLLLWELCDPK